MIVKVMRTDEFTQERGLGMNRSISARTLRNANMGGGNKNLQRQVGRSHWKFSKKAREGKSGEFGVRRTK